MTTIIMRSFAERMGVHWPQEIALLEDGKPVTWADIHKARTKHQNKRLWWKREYGVNQKRAAYIWVFYQPGLFGFAYAGWHLYIRTLNNSWWIRHNHYDDTLMLDIMRRFPCGIIPVRENFNQWKEAFAKTYSRPGRFKKQGLVLGWVEFASNGWPETFTPCQSFPNPAEAK